MTLMEGMGAFGGIFGIIMSIIQTIIQMRQTRKQELLNELQQQYEEEMSQFNTAFSQVTQQIQMDTQYSYQYEQQNQAQNNQLFEGGAGSNPTQAGTDRLQKQAEKSAKLAVVYNKLAKRERSLRNQILNLRSQETNEYNADEQSIANGTISYGSLLGKEFTQSGIDGTATFKQVSTNISDTLSGWLNDVSNIAASVEQDNTNSLTSAYIQMNELTNQISSFMNNYNNNGFINTTIDSPTEQEVQQKEGDLWGNILNIKPTKITNDTRKRNTLTTKEVAKENFGVWKAKPKAITRMGTRRVKP